MAQGKKRGVSSSRLELLKAKLQEYLAKEECYKKSSPKILAKCYMNIIDIYTDLAQFDKALDYGRLQLALARAQQDHIDELRVINSIGRIYLLQGQCSTEPEKAKISFNNAENTLNTGIELLSSFKHELKNPETFNMKARLFLNISIVQEQLGHIDKALENVWRATMICNSENLFDVLYQCHYNEARFLFKKMDFSTALNCCTKALEVVKKLKDEARKYDTLSLKAKILCKLSDYENAKRIYLKAYKLNSQLQIDDHDDVIGNLKAAATMCYSRDLLTQYNSSGSVNHIASKTLYETLGDGACHFKNYDEAVNHYIKSLYHAETAGVSEKLLIPIYVRYNMETRLRASHEQFGILIEYMESHNDLARPQQGAQGRLRADSLWQELTHLLNSAGGGVQKITEKWKKVWADWKTKTKKKALLIRRDVAGTGGGPRCKQILTPLEERVLSLIGLSAVIGQRSIEEQGFEVELLVEAQQLPPSASELPISPVPLAINESDLAQEVRRPIRRTPPSATVPNSSEQSTPHSRVHRPRRRVRHTTPFDRAAREFVRIEERRIQLE